MKSFTGHFCKTALGILLAALILGSNVTAYATNFPTTPYSEDVYITEDTYNTLSKGTTVYNGVDYAKLDGYNPLYYFLNYKDLRDAFGADPAKLVEHWATHGKAEKRISNTLIVRYGETQSSNWEYVVPTNQLTKKQEPGMTVISGEVHSNGGMTRTQEDQARSVAKQIAEHVYDQVTTKGDGSQISMVAYATAIVNAYCARDSYVTTGKIYRTAYGVFLGGEYSCAGSTRALGLVLDYLDGIMQDKNKAGQGNWMNKEGEDWPPLKWNHVNANKWDDQWCRIVCDKHEAYGDPIIPSAGYGKHPNEGGKKQDVREYMGFATEADVFTTLSPQVDGQYPITQDPQKNR